MKLSGKVRMLDRLISDLKLERRDPFAKLKPGERAVVEAYQRKTPPMQRYLDAINGTGPTVSLLHDVGLPADCTELEARTAYESELHSFDNWYIRRQALERFKR